MPADVRLIESHDLKFDKSMLTGESDAIEGTVDCTDDRYVESKNIAYMTTLITQGQGNISNLKYVTIYVIINIYIIIIIIIIIKAKV